MERIILYTITEQEENLCIIEFLKQQGFSRHILRSMKDFPGSILLNGSPSRGRALLRSGDSLRIFVPETDPWDKIPPVSVDLNVLYEDEDLLVLNKPAGMPVHPSVGNHGNTLANAAAAWFLHKVDRVLFRCINRLDRDTSGALILAKNPLSRLCSLITDENKTDPPDLPRRGQRDPSPSGKYYRSHRTYSRFSDRTADRFRRRRIRGNPF